MHFGSYSHKYLSIQNLVQYVQSMNTFVQVKDVAFRENMFVMDV